MRMLAAAGGEEFLLGFRLAGVRNTINTEENAEEKLTDLMEAEEIGIVVLDEKTLRALPKKFQDDVNDSVNPVFVTLKEKDEGSNIRAKIMRAIGVDLWER